MDSIGSRAEVLHGTKKMTAGGLTKKNLMIKGGRIVSKAASQAATKRMKSEGKKHLTKVFKPVKKGFKLQPKADSAAYKKLVKKM